MKVSVIIPCYNVEQYIEKCINSLIQTEVFDYEIIAINDGSTDGTLNLLTQLGSRYSQLKVISVENNGVSQARNLGIDQAQGEYILFVDADDWLEKDYVTQLYNICCSENLDLLMFNYVEYYNNGKTKKNMVFNKNKQLNSLEAVRELLVNHNTPAIWNKMIRREILIKNRIKFIPDIKIGEDLLYSTHVLLNCQKIKQINDACYYYYMRENSATHHVSEKVLTVKNAVQRVQDLLENKNVLDILKEEYEFISYLHLYFYRVIVGPIQQPYHRDFYRSYPLDSVKSNKYYQLFIKSNSANIKLRLFLYQYFPYNIAMNIHRIMRRLSQ